MLFLDGVVWQVGERGSIYTSSDLDLWLPQESGTTKSLRSITSFGNKVYISGEEGTILSGATPRDLTVRTLGTTNWLEGIAASSGTIVTVGDNGAIYSSLDGVTWDKRGDFTTWFRSVAHGAGQFVAVGEGGFIATSSDGGTWIERPSGTTAHLNRVSWLDDRFWIVGDHGAVLTNDASASAFSLVDVGVTNTLFTVSANTNEIIIAGEGVVLLGNREGGPWVRQSDSGSPLLAPMWPYYSSIWDGRLFLLSGQTGMLVEGFRTNASAPLHWYSTIQPTRSWLWSVSRPADFFVAVGVNGTIVTSNDGVEWAREAPPSTLGREVLLGVNGNTNTLLAVGSSGTVLRSEHILTNILSTNLLGEVVSNLVSLLGVNWESLSAGVTNDLQGVAVTDDLFVVTGANGMILTSDPASNGTEWTRRESGVNSFLSGVTAWPQGFVAVGAEGVILTSDDGSTWTQRNSGEQRWVYAVKYVGGRLVAVGENGLILTSSDAIDWQSRDSGTTNWLNDVTFAEGTWYVTGGDGTLVTSNDGASWTAEKAISSKSLYGAATDGRQVIAVGMEGVILRKNLQLPTTPVNIESYENAGFSDLFLFTGKVDQQFVLEQSDSVNGPWRPAAYLEVTAPDGTVIFELANEGAPRKFFRTHLSEP